MGNTFYVSVWNELVDDIGPYLDKLETESRRLGEPISFNPAQLELFASYDPIAPKRLYGMHRDQVVSDFDDFDEDRFIQGDPLPRYSPNHPRLPVGKNMFVLDESGWLIAGPRHHHHLSGGGRVGAAGQLILEPSGLVADIHLNFSGHYRPPLSADYARFTYRTLAGHPLLEISPRCRISGRKFEVDSEYSPPLVLNAGSLLRNDEELDDDLERFRN